MGIFINKSKNVALNKFKQIKLTDTLVDKYKKDHGTFTIGMKHCRIDNNTTGYVWVDDGDNVVGYVTVQRKDVGKYITALEVSKEYKGNNLGGQILTFAESRLGAELLSVNKKNTTAFELYRKHGWVVDDESDHMYFMKKGR